MGVLSYSLPVQRILDPGRSCIDQRSQQWIQSLESLLHLPSDLSIREMSLDTAAQSGDVLQLGEVHFK